LVDGPWESGGLTQAQFWPVDFADTYGDGHAGDCLSYVITDWTKPGIVYRKPARDCTPVELVHDAWEQLKRHLNEPGEVRLTDQMLHSWTIDPRLVRRNGRWVNEDPLVLPTAGQRPYRPDVTTAIPNLVLAGDYLVSEWEVANMETASYNGRRAANAILEKASSKESPAKAIKPYSPPDPTGPEAAHATSGDRPVVPSSRDWRSEPGIGSAPPECRQDRRRPHPRRDGRGTALKGFRSRRSRHGDDICRKPGSDAKRGSHTNRLGRHGSRPR